MCLGERNLGEGDTYKIFFHTPFLPCKELVYASGVGNMLEFDLPSYFNCISINIPDCIIHGMLYKLTLFQVNSTVRVALMPSVMI